MTGEERGPDEIELVAFDEPLPRGVDAAAMLGGKGAGLAQMTRELGLPVPPGFTITTAVGRRVLESGWPPDLDDHIEHYLDRLARQLGRRFGDPVAPLLVSVRSGGPVSMPGMMDTLLNVGITEEIRDRLQQESGSPAFAADTWLRFHRMYAEVVLGLPKTVIDAAAGRPADPGESLAATERVRALADRETAGIPADPYGQLRGAIEAVFRSWNSHRARVFRDREGIPHNLCTAATIQAMVFGNLDDRSGTGVVFTRDPATGDPTPYGDYLPRAQGDDVVAGGHAVQGLDALRDQLPAVHDQLMDVLRRLEHHYRDMCDVEFTVSNGHLYILQARVGRRSPLAAVRIAVAMAEEPGFPLTPREAVKRVDAAVLQQLATLGGVDPSARPLATGLPASPGVGAGVLCCDADRAAEWAARGESVVLAREETSPADVHGMVQAAAVVTTRGGVASHAAVVARGWGIPAVTSLAGAEVRPGGLLISGEMVAEGELVTVDGAAGALYRGDRRQAGTVDLPEVRTLREWAAAAAGHDPPGAVDAPGDPRGAREVTLFEVLRAVQLKGLCSPEQAARCVGTTPETVERLLDGCSDYVQSTPRGFFLSPQGRAWVAEQLEAERRDIDRAAFESAYQRFADLNRRFKQLVSDWQQSAANESDGSAGTWERVVDTLEDIHAGMQPVLAAGAALPRLAPYTHRFQAALDALRAGDASMLAAPLKDSYHTVWFEYHEELIALLGLDRAAEERAEQQHPSPDTR